jgi:hypothetical protein
MVVPAEDTETEVVVAVMPAKEEDFNDVIQTRRQMAHLIQLKRVTDGKCLKNRVGETGLFPVSTSHTTVRTVWYTAVL